MNIGEFIKGADFDLEADLSEQVYPTHGYNFYDDVSRIVEDIESLDDDQLSELDSNWQQVFGVARYTLGHVMSPVRQDPKLTQSDLLLEVFMDLYGQMDSYDDTRSPIFTFATVRARRTAQVIMTKYSGQIVIPEHTQKQIILLKKYLLPEESERSVYESIDWLNVPDELDGIEQPSRLKAAMELIGATSPNTLHNLLRGWAMRDATLVPVWEIAEAETLASTMVGEGPEHLEDTELFDEIFEREDTNQQIQKAIDLASRYLTDAELAVMTLYFGLDGNEPLGSHSPIAELSKLTEHHFSRGRVHQIGLSSMAKVSRAFVVGIMQGKPALQHYMIGLKSNGTKSYKRQLNREIDEFRDEVGADTISNIIDKVTESAQNMTDEDRSALNSHLRNRFKSGTAPDGQKIGQFRAMPFETEVLFRIQRELLSR